MARHGLGARPDIHDPRDYTLADARLPHITPPAAVDLRPHALPVRDQGDQGSCTGFALAALREVLANLHGGGTTPLSPAFIYWQEREREGDPKDCNAGAMLRDGMRSLHKTGACVETDLPYDPARCGAPDKAALHDGASRLIRSYHRCLSTQHIKVALANALPVVIGIAVYSSFESDAVARTGMVPIPGAGEELLGGHAVAVLGYTDNPQQPGGGTVLFRNSWGSGWGDGGYGRLPYLYVDNPKLCFDAWFARV